MTPVYKIIFYTNVLRILDERNMTKTDLAKRSGVSISFLSDLTTGKANPSLKVMEAIAAALETPLPELLESTHLDKAALDVRGGGGGGEEYAPPPPARRGPAVCRLVMSVCLWCCRSTVPSL